MRVTAHADPSLFSALAQPLWRDEAMNCMVLGVIESRVSAAERPPRGQLLSISGPAGLAGVAWWNPPQPLLLSALPSAAVQALVEYAASTHAEGVHAVAGPKPAVDEFKERWLERRGGRVQKTLEQRIHQLDRVTPRSRAAGRLRTASPADQALVVAWSLCFVADCGLDDSAESVQSAATWALSRGSRVLWEVEGEAVSMAGFGGKTPSGIRVSSVYTPPELRGRGYASALVAALSEQLLAGGRTYCFLYTDRDNATSNRIYREIGYRPVCDAAYHSLSE